MKILYGYVRYDWLEDQNLYEHLRIELKQGYDSPDWEFITAQFLTEKARNYEVVIRPNGVQLKGKEYNNKMAKEDFELAEDCQSIG